MPEIENIKEITDEFLEDSQAFIERAYERAEQYRDELREEGKNV